jgi:poly(A) polymerase
MAISLNRETFGQLIDPFDGIGDIKRKIIRTPRDPDITFSDDPLRMLRAIRFSTQLGFQIESQTFESIKRNVERFDILSIERVTVELEKIILSPRPSVGFKALSASGLLHKILPEVENLHGVENKEGYRHKDNFYHSLEVLDNISLSTDNIWLRWAALLHDIGKKATKRFDPNLGWTFHGHEYKGSKMAASLFKRLKLPMNQRLKYVQKMICLHMRPIVLAQEIVTDSAVRRLLFEAGDDIDDLMLMCDADITSKNQEKVYQFLSNYQLVRQKLKDIEEKDRIRNFQPPISGELIMKIFKLEPSKEVGSIKDAIKEAILDGTIENNFDAALNYMYLKAAELGIPKSAINFHQN